MSTFYALLLLASIAVMVIGIARKVIQYSATPAPLKIPVTPAPKTVSGVVYRMAKEIILFSSLFRASKWTWIFGYMFHLGLLLAFFRHLRYLIDPNGLFGFMWPIISLEIVQSFGKYAGFLMVIGLFGLLLRRIFVQRVRYISAPSDYLMLILIMIIGLSGLTMSFIPAAYIDIVQMKQFVLGLFIFDFQELPESIVLLVHLAFVALLAFISPISKLLHIPGLFFSPTRYQIDNPREKRHISDWGKKLDKTRADYPEFQSKAE